jgi:hypothetical protein
MTDAIQFHPSAPMLMGNAQHDPAPQVGSPSITEHMAFWISDTKVDDWQGWVKEIEKFALNLHKLLAEDDKDKKKGHGIQGIKGTEVRLLKNDYVLGVQAWQLKQPAAPAAELQGTRYETINFRGALGSLPLGIQLELHKEYFTLTTTIDLSLKNEKNLYYKDGETQFGALKKALDELNRFLTDRYAKVIDGQPQRIVAPSAQLAETVCPALFTNLWEAVQRTYIAPALGEVGQNNVGQVFGHFRMLALTRGLLAEKKSVWGKRKFPFINLPWSEINKKAPPRTLEEIMRGIPFEQRSDGEGSAELIHGTQLVDTLFPLLLASGGAEAGQREHIFAPMENNSVIYASALGPQKPNAAPNDVVPVTSVLYACHDERFQLGRLVDRLLTLGTLRLAALYDLHKVEHANELLRGVETELDALNKDLPESLKAGGEDVADDVLRLSTRLARIARGEEEGKKEYEIIGGLPHRAERSNYYWQAFLDLVADLGGGRIKGSQAYDQFIRRASGGSYNFIRMVGERLQRLQTIIAEIDEKIQTEESVRTQKTTAKWTKKSAKFLMAADIFVCAVASPYYIIHNLPEALGKEFMQEHFKNDTSFSRTVYTVGTILALRDILIGAFVCSGKALINAVKQAPETMRNLPTDIKRCSMDPQTVFALELLYDDLATKNQRPQINTGEHTISISDNAPTPT